MILWTNFLQRLKKTDHKYGTGQWACHDRPIACLKKSVERRREKVDGNFTKNIFWDAQML